MTEPITDRPKPAFTPMQQEHLKDLADAGAQYIRESVEALSQFVNMVLSVAEHALARAEALERLLVAKDIITSEELRNTLTAVEAERMVNRALGGERGPDDA